MLGITHRRDPIEIRVRNAGPLYTHVAHAATQGPLRRTLPYHRLRRPDTLDRLTVNAAHSTHLQSIGVMRNILDALILVGQR